MATKDESRILYVIYRLKMGLQETYQELITREGMTSIEGFSRRRTLQLQIMGQWVACCIRTEKRKDSDS